MSWAEHRKRQGSRVVEQKKATTEIISAPQPRKAKRVFLQPTLSAEELLKNYRELEIDKDELADWMKSLSNKNKETLLKAKKSFREFKQVVKIIDPKERAAQISLRKEVKKNERLEYLEKRSSELKLERQKAKEAKKAEKLELIRLQREHKLEQRMAKKSKAKKERQQANSKVTENANMCPTMPGPNGTTILLMDSKTRITVPVGKDPEAVYWKYFNRDKNL